MRTCAVPCLPLQPAQRWPPQAALPRCSYGCGLQARRLALVGCATAAHHSLPLPTTPHSLPTTPHASPPLLPTRNTSRHRSWRAGTSGRCSCRRSRARRRRARLCGAGGRRRWPRCPRCARSTSTPSRWGTPRECAEGVRRFWAALEGWGEGAARCARLGPTPSGCVQGSARTTHVRAWDGAQGSGAQLRRAGPHRFQAGSCRQGP